MWWRKRKARAQGLQLPLTRAAEEAEESIPLTRREGNDSSQDFRPRKGKERAENEPIFDVGSDDEDEQNYRSRSGEAGDY